MDLSVLILTGAHDTRSVLSRIFSTNGWAVEEGGATADAADCIRRNPARLIVTESRLPDGTWEDILALVQATAPEVQVVVTSPHADEALWAEVLYRGAFDVISQPLDESEVMRVSASALRHSTHVHAAAAT